MNNTLEKNRKELGMLIRASRLQYHWSEKHGAYVRVTSKGPQYRVDVAPRYNVPAERNRRGYEAFWVWWEDLPKLGETLDVISPLRNVREVDEPFSFYVGDDGNLVGSPPATLRRFL